ncbi:unnamed protein product [Anisakis simplex]|uniref:RING-type domain-containing protein n=1 Tax=Anisakis simplex TaxID=6269 RepID=A0A158PMW6_ANISI|nr:unnamed protein product [Anisakis simplex]
MATADDVAPTLVDTNSEFVTNSNIIDILEPTEAAFLQMANATQMNPLRAYANQNPYAASHPYHPLALGMPMLPFLTTSALTSTSSQHSSTPHQINNNNNNNTSNIASSSLSFSALQMPTVVNPTAFLHSTAISPIIVPRMDAFLTTAGPISAPCAYFTGSEAIPAICQPLYPQPYFLQPRPLNNTHLTLPTTGTISSANQQMSHSFSSANAQRVNQVDRAHLFDDQPTSSAISTEIPVLPPTLAAAPPLRSAAMRLKRPAVRHSSVNCSNNASSSFIQPKIRRFLSEHGETSSTGATSSAHTPSSASIELPIDDEEETGTQRSVMVNRIEPHREIPNSVIDGASSGLSAYQTNEFWHPYQQISDSAVNVANRSKKIVSRREIDVNPIHNSLLSSRIAQLERERQANSAWFQRHPMAAGSLVGLDVVGRRATSLLPLQRYPNPLVELSVVNALLQHNEVNGAIGAAALPSDPLPVGASVERIISLTQVLKYVRDIDLPEAENERCTVCLVDFETDDSVRSLPCAHIFHVDCIDRWLVYNKKCPVCRLDIDACESEAAQ